MRYPGLLVVNPETNAAVYQMVRSAIFKMQNYKAEHSKTFPCALYQPLTESRLNDFKENMKDYVMRRRSLNLTRVLMMIDGKSNVFYSHSKSSSFSSLPTQILGQETSHRTYM